METTPLGRDRIKNVRKTEFDSGFWAVIDNFLATSRLVVDRPKGTRHPDYPDFVYPLNYGYLEGTSSPDGGGIDVWIGSSGTGAVDAVLLTVDIAKRDSEIKLLLSCTDKEKDLIYGEQNKEGMFALFIPRNHTE